MKFMMFMIPKVGQPDTSANEQTEEGGEIQVEELAAMSKFNDELEKAGDLISVNGLHSAANGVRVSFKGEAPVVTDGPFAEAKEVIGGYWVIDVDSKEEAVKWATKCPAAEGDVIEIRQIFEKEDFPEDVREAVERSKARQ